MNKITEPVLLPFCDNIRRLFEVTKKGDFSITLYPLYKFWGRKMLLQTLNVPTDEEVFHLYEKVITKCKEIEDKSKYYNLIYNVYNDKETALVIDKLYQIPMSQKEKDIIVFIISNLTEPHFKYGETNYSIFIPLAAIVYELSKKVRFLLYNDLTYNEISDVNIRRIFLRRRIKNMRFGCIYDSLPRRETFLYDYSYLQMMSLFTRERETLTNWQERMESVAKNNLLNNGYIIIKTYPTEEIDRMDSIIKKLKYNKIRDGVYKNPSLQDIIKRKKVNRFY